MICNLHVDIWLVAPAVHIIRPQGHLAGVVRVFSVVHLDRIVPAGQRVRAVHADAEVTATCLERDAKCGSASAQRHGLDLVLGVDEQTVPYFPVTLESTNNLGVFGNRKYHDSFLRTSISPDLYVTEFGIVQRVNFPV